LLKRCCGNKESKSSKRGGLNNTNTKAKQENIISIKLVFLITFLFGSVIYYLLLKASQNLDV